MEKLRTNTKHAIMIGTLCAIAYFSVYIARNILSAVTPEMVDLGFSEEYIGSISSLYFVFYAVGQLINGIIGDKIHAKYMMCMGLLGAGITNIVFAHITPYPTTAALIYALTGFFLSMIYGPMTKMVSENTEPLHAARCSLGYTFSSFFGSPAAGLLAVFLSWQTVFDVGSIALFVMAAVCFVSFTAFEKRKIVQYGQYKPKKKGLGGVGILFRYHIVKFSMISIITGVVRTSVLFWLPTYLAQHLAFPTKTAAAIFTAATLVISLSAFIAVFTYEKLGNDIHKTVLLMFSSATVFFILTYFISHPIGNIICIVLAIMSSNGAASMLWSEYCPSLRDTGMVSSATGFLDFLSYMAAAAANLIFANAVTSIGWGNLILIWFGLMIVGVIVALPFDRIKARLSSKK